MARKNWNALQIEYIKSYAKTGVSVMEWCRKKGLNFATAKRYIKKPETAFAQLEESKQSNIRAQAETSPKEDETAKSENVSEVIDIKDDLTEKCESNCESQSETAKPTAKPSRFSSELQSQRRIKHGGYARYFKDKSAFDVVVDFSLKDEIDLMRQRAIASIENLEKFTDDLKRCTTADDKEVTYKLINAAQNALDRAVARIESLSRTNNDIDLTLETIELRKAQTKETLLKADKLAQELGVRAASKHKVEYTMDFTGGDNED